MYRILIIEDDMVIAETVKEQLIMWGYQATCCHDFQNVMETFKKFEPQLVLLDITLPFYNGYHWCMEIRKLTSIPIIFLSSASDNMNIVMAMNMGGDDFIAKPFDLHVLIAKIQAILRRAYSFTNQNDILEIQGAILNLGDATFSYKNEKIELTRNEFKILRILAENKGKTVSREDIMTYLWESDSFIDDNTLTVNVTRIRKRLEAIGLSEMIVTKKGIGYMVVDA